MTDNRYQRGLKKIQEIHGEAGKKVIESMEAICPDLARFILEFPFAEIYTRPGLDTKTRQLITIAALTTLGSAPTQLKAHIRGALNVGCTEEEIKEVILQTTVYAGFPAANNAMIVAGEIFKEKK
ncbi:MAG: carboxymuconolactone decarboxylase family protein [bacterium]